MVNYDTVWVFLTYLPECFVVRVSSEWAPFCWFNAESPDFSIFPKLADNLKFVWESKLEALWKLLVTRQIDANFLILQIKLIASLPLGCKCSPPLFNSFEVMFPMSVTYNKWKPCKYLARHVMFVDRVKPCHYYFPVKSFQ